MPKKVKPDAEVIELIAEYSVKGISQKAKDKLNSANDKLELLNIYNDLIKTSDYMLENGDLSPQRQDKFEDEIWKEYKDVLKKKFKDSNEKLNNSIGKNIKFGKIEGILVDYTNDEYIVQTMNGIINIKK